MISQSEKQHLRQSHMAQAKKAQEKPHLYVIAGANGAGKSTLRNMLFDDKSLPVTALHHDPDNVMTSLTGYIKDTQDADHAHMLAEAFDKWELPARELSEEILNHAITEQTDIIYERSCGVAGSLEFISEMKEKHGYEIIFYMVFTPLRIAAQRAQTRMKKEGRFTPESIIQERAQALYDQLEDFLELSDKAYLYDNAGLTPQLVFDKCHANSTEIIRLKNLLSS